MGLARESEYRFIFRFISLRDKFADLRQQKPEKTLSDLECLVALIGERLSDDAKEVLKNAQERYDRYFELLLTVFKKTGTKNYKTPALRDAAQIKAIVDFERKGRDKDWRFLPDGIQGLSDDFLLFHEYLRMFHSVRFRSLCSAWSDFLLTDDEKEEVANAPEEGRTEMVVEKVRPQLRPIWSFFIALCYVLQRGENQLTATDAFWLGLIDEVIGVRELPSLRLFVEHAREDAEQKQNEQKQIGQAQAAEAAAGA